MSQAFGKSTDRKDALKNLILLSKRTRLPEESA